MNSLLTRFLSAQNKNTSYNDYALLMLRVFIGLTMAFSHGLGKVPPPDMLVSGLESMGFPMPFFFAWAASLAEFAGGILLALGLLTRPAALSMTITMAVAAFVAHAADPFAKKEMALLYLVTSAFICLVGAGKISLDSLLFKRK